MFYYTASLLLLSMRLFSLRPATAIRAATACALAFIVIVYTSLSALFSLLAAVLRSTLRALAVLSSAALLTTVLRSARRALAVPISATLLSAGLRSALRTLSVAALHCAAVIAHLSVSVFFECAAVLLSSITRPTVPLTSTVPTVALLTSAALLTSVIRSAHRAVTVLTSAALLTAVLRSALRAVTVLTSAALLTAVLRSARRAVTVLTSAALLTAVLRSTLRALAVLISVALQTAVLRSARRTLAVLSSAALLTFVLRSAFRTLAVPTSAALLTAVLRSALRALSVRASFLHAARSTVVSAIFTVDIRTVTHSHGPALASDGHGVVLILLQIRGAKEQGIKRLRRSGILIYHIALRIRNRHLSPSPLRRIEGNNQTLLRRTAVV